VVEFHVLPGDVNGDRVVNELDLFQIWRNAALPVIRQDLNADLNGDGHVTAADIQVVTGNYLGSVPVVFQLQGLGASMLEEVASTGVEEELLAGEVETSAAPERPTAAARGLVDRGTVLGPVRVEWWSRWTLSEEDDADGLLRLRERRGRRMEAAHSGKVVIDYAEKCRLVRTETGGARSGCATTLERP